MTPIQNPLIAIVMAAGKGTRMNSDSPKVLHAIAGEPLLGHVLHTLEALPLESSFVIVGHGGSAVQAMLPPSARAVWQHEQRGTGHAIQQVTPQLEAFTGTVLILSGDVPLLSESTLQALLEAHSREGAALTFLSTELRDPSGYGRLLRNAEGRVTGIVEHKDATAEQRAIREVNVGTYVCSWPLLRRALAGLVPNNAQGEYYLTDAIASLVQEGHKVASYQTPDPLECSGINTRQELARLQAEYNRRTAARWMKAGVTFISPDSNVIGPRVKLGKDTIVEPGALILGVSVIGERCLIGAYSQLNNMMLGDDVEVLHSYLVDSRVGNATRIGPYAHLRGGAVIGERVRLGNFVEVKKSTLGDGTKAAHLAYLGDASIGAGVNIGCGVITANYDGKRKHETTIHDGAFVGSNSNLIAPITIGQGAFVAAGSTLTSDVPAGALAIARGRQTNKEDWQSGRKGPQAAPTEA